MKRKESRRREVKRKESRRRKVKRKESRRREVTEITTEVERKEEKREVYRRGSRAREYRGRRVKKDIECPCLREQYGPGDAAEIGPVVVAPRRRPDSRRRVAFRYRLARPKDQTGHEEDARDRSNDGD